ncbi:MAG: UDP-N-acetylglucosamine 2-epimerase (hydrolyzing) [SAR324 cluster bacterium]|uniref:UDP-N-acetylglucosamine 2-epimerase (Hydrolyzing) n=1 Tax=SAR324 cluster bacterium TaxID=2024889 RepID=A0A7X9IL04_9DELT|nr:UDP-N-acetylglucosamine 2-epimerase (hydrolyzing) [SAR324 cluster bacterium]
MMKVKICVVTGSRAEYGYLNPFMRCCLGNEKVELQIVVAGTHLHPDFGNTISCIENDGFQINEKVNTLVEGDSPSSIAKSMGLALIGFGEVFEKLNPDLLVLLGDRYEILAAASAALLSRIPIAHFCGGDITNGAYDDAIRHSITKMSHVHFVTHEEAKSRVIQLGEDPSHVFNVGSLSLDGMKKYKLIPREDLASQLGIDFRERNIVITYHPPTLYPDRAKLEITEILAALDELGENVGLVFTRPTLDAEYLTIVKAIDEFVAEHANAFVFSSLGQQRYYSLLSLVDVVVGNSSSGIYEAPSFGKATVNIGDRQKGRKAAASVVHVKAERAAIKTAIEQAFLMDCSQIKNPYEQENTAQRSLDIILSFDSLSRLITKEFFSIGKE